MKLRTALTALAGPFAFYSFLSRPLKMHAHICPQFIFLYSWVYNNVTKPVSGWHPVLGTAVRTCCETKLNVFVRNEAPE